MRRVGLWERGLRALVMLELHLGRVIDRRLTGWIRTDRFGVLEAIAYGWRIDVWQRHAIVANTIGSMGDSCRSIIDVGSGGSGIARFIDLTDYRICLVDPIGHSEWTGRRAASIRADGCHLPFRDRSFDVAVSVDALEHLPARSRRLFADELKRVARRAVLLHVPAVSADGQWKGLDYDIRFQRWHRWLSGGEDRNTAEHIAFGLPTLEELRTYFPGARIAGRQKCNVWLAYMILERVPVIGMLTGFFYMLALARRDHRPPYHACFIEYWRDGAILR